MNRSLMETDMQNTTMQDTTAKSPTARKPVARQRLMIASLLGMTMLGAVQVLPAVALETMGENLGLDFQQKGLMFSLRILTAIPALLLIGHYAERPYKRHILFWGLMALVLGQILTA
jgi:predicted MFS family arabinose efflux permease